LVLTFGFQPVLMSFDVVSLLAQQCSLGDDPLFPRTLSTSIHPTKLAFTWDWIVDNFCP
jgi:hypothetical protein